MEQFSSSRHLFNSVIICHNSTWTPEDISTSTHSATVKLRGSVKPRTVLTVVHLLLSDCSTNKNVLAVMSAIKKCQGAGRLVSAVLSNVSRNVCRPFRIFNDEGG